MSRPEGSAPTSTPGGPGKGNIVQANVEAGAVVGDIIGSTIGPRGMDKLLWEPDDDFDRYFEVSNDASFLLKRISFEAPAASMIASVASAQEDRYGDGTGIAAIFASSVLDEAGRLITEGFHPRTVIEGIKQAVDVACDRIEAQSTSVDPNDDERLRQVAATCLGGSSAEQVGSSLPQWIVDATRSVARQVGDGLVVDDELVQTEAIRSGTVQQTRTLDGMVLKKEFAGTHSPTVVEDATVGLVTQGFARQRAISERLAGAEGDDSRTVSFSPDDAAGLAEFQQAELDLVGERIEPLVDAGVDVLLVEDRVEDEILRHFDRAGIAVVRNARIDRMKKVAAATGATINKHIDAFEEADTGHARQVVAETVGNQDVLLFEGGAAEDAVSILVRGSTWATGWEIERNVSNAVQAVGAAITGPGVVPGGGAVEVDLAAHIRATAPSYGGRESIVMEAVADAIERIPEQLARNAGLDPVDTLLQLRTVHSQGDYHGVLGVERKVGDPAAEGVMDVSAVKSNALQVAMGTTTSILRIDDVITDLGLDGNGVDGRGPAGR